MENRTSISIGKICQATLILGAVNILLFVLFWFGSADSFLFETSEEFNVGPILSLIGAAMATYTWIQEKKRNAWFYTSVILGVLMPILWVGFGAMFYFTYSNCPNGLC